jgi:hypothetical protein
MKMGPEDDVVTETVRHLTETLGMRLPRTKMQGDPISAHDLKSLVELALAASLAHEEERPTRFSLAVFDGPRRQPLVGPYMRLKEPLELNLNNLVKLAPATAAGESYICVTEDPDARKIWGTTRHSPMGTFVLIDVVGWGVARIRCGSHTLAYFRPEGDSFVGDTHILALAFGIGKAMGTRDDGFVLMSIVGEMLSLGHGGTLLLVPSEGDDWRKGIESIKYACDPAYTTLRGLVDGVRDSRRKAADLQGDSAKGSELEVRNAFDFTRASEDALGEEYAAVGRFGAVDGALVVDAALGVRGFGAKIAYSGTLDRVIEITGLAHPKRAERRANEIGGMRHQSAAAFVQACKGALAFVVSQDRKVSLVAWNETENASTLIRSLELLL